MLETKEVLLRCSNCRNQKHFMLNRDQRQRLAEGGRLEFRCGQCCCPQYWEPVEDIQITRASATRRQPKSILVVDDDDLTLKLLTRVLESWEADIGVAKNGQEALSMLASKDVDLLICDIRMPEMSGQELFEHIRKNAFLPLQRIVFLTGDKSATVKPGCKWVLLPL